MERLIAFLKRLGCFRFFIIKSWQLYLTIFRPWQIKTYLKTHSIRKMQIGTGTGYNAIPGWLNTDFIPRSRKLVFLDATKRFPLEDGTLDYIFNEEMLEHIEYPDGLNMLRESFRTLKPGGKIRIATPNFDFLIGLYKNKEKTEFQKKFVSYSMKVHVQMPIEIHQHQEVFVINQYFRGWGHKFIYNYGVLHDLLSQIGFINITRYKVRESDDKNLQGLEAHDINYAILRSEEDTSLFVEAQKPQ